MGKISRTNPVIDADDMLIYDCKIHLVTSIYLTMMRWSWRYTRRYLYIAYGVLFLLILFFNVQICKWQFNVDDDRIDRPTYCNQSIIRKHFMHDQRPQELFAQKPSRSFFTYELSNTNACSSISLHALIFVVSKSSSFGVRNAIRRTWGDFTPVTSITKFAHLHLKLLFLVDIDQTYLLNINLEQSLYHDLVQVRLPQHYTLSTYRDMAILDWTETYCSQALVIIKTDDDIFLNTFLLANVLTTMTRNMTVHRVKPECRYIHSFDPSAIIYGVKFHRANVVRDVHDLALEDARYIVTDEEYPCRYYPDYMSGFGYIVNRNARSQLLCAFYRHKKSFHLSDVYVTGILPEYLHIQRQHLRFRISYHSADDCDEFFNQNNAYACASLLHYQTKESSSLMDVRIFERFNTYWKRLYRNRLLYINHNRFY